MNCPGHMLLFGSQLRSYRDLPLRYAEAAPLHRNELAGALHGLTRVRYVTQDDAHIFCTRGADRRPSSTAALDYLRYLYGLFGIEPRAELSTRPENKLGTDEEWDFTEGELVEALERHGIAYVVGAGEGSFYGPKIDLHMTDVLGRSWQMGTIQLDAQMPARFGLTYMGADNQRAPGVRHPPRALRLVRALHRDPHRALRRRVPALARAGAGARAARGRAAPRAARTRSPERLREAGYRVDVDERDETLGKRIRDAELEKIPFVVVYGDRESEAALAVRERGEGQSTRSLDGAAGGSRALLVAPSRADRGSAYRARAAPCYALPPASRGRYPHLRSHELAGVQPSRTTRETVPLPASGLCVSGGSCRLEGETAESLVRGL